MRRYIKFSFLDNLIHEKRIDKNGITICDVSLPSVYEANSSGNAMPAMGEPSKGQMCLQNTPRVQV